MNVFEQTFNVFKGCKMNKKHLKDWINLSSMKWEEDEDPDDEDAAKKGDPKEI